MKQLRFDKDDRKQISFYWSKSQYKKFQERFPNLTSYFLSKCMELSLEKSDFVSSVLLKDFSSMEVEK